jgi:tetratricopeptide (TPR) repeat protein
MKANINPVGITRPIPLLAFYGLMIQGIIAILAYTAQDTVIFPILAVALVTLPLILLGMIYKLITAHHDKLYSPSDFSESQEFVELVKRSSTEINRVGVGPNYNIFTPHIDNTPLPDKTEQLIDEEISDVKQLLISLEPTYFEIFHSWFNSQEKHDLALLCMDIAIANGANTSKNFAFRSASLRKLNRFVEARHSALIACELDEKNSDAFYNLAIIYKQLNQNAQAVAAAKKVIQLGESNAAINKLRAKFPEEGL